MSGKIIEILVMEGIAILLFLFAYLLGVKGQMNLIAGYNEKTAHRVKDKAGLKRLITRLCILLAIGSALMPILSSLFYDVPGGIAYVIGGYAGFICGLVGMVMLQARDYAG